MRHSPVTHTDDTGWRVGGEPAFLMAFETDKATVYQIRPRHRNQEVREVVPSDYRGVLVTDRGRSYDAQSLDQVRQQKCLAHVLRSISQAVETKKGRGRSFGNRLKRLLREAMALWQAYHLGEAEEFAAEAQRLTREVTYHLRDRPLTDSDNWRLQNELGWHNDRGNLLRFLSEPNIEPTNNRAERALRPAVIARKVSHCSYGTERLPARDFPAAVADNVYYFSPDEHIYALDTATGEILWSYEAGMMINTAPVTAGGIVYVGSESGRFYALDAATGGLVWSRESMAWALQSPMVADGVLYAESSDGHLRALDAATGEELWRFQKGYFDGIPSYTVTDGVMYVGSLDGGVYAFIAPLGTTTEEKVLTIP